MKVEQTNKTLFNHPNIQYLELNILRYSILKTNEKVYLSFSDY